ncbi:alpha-amylase family glycosyl hydrolase [Arthrobacter agilis]|uniref:alpha-amylase family glycosyl hydrolase n=1 Tax=Arthrobacter agilis TaxID=37921 RepID=UPI0023653C40|nr:alpha-amylase family glycosyl hydrolase [Arthrobacter agilis]WDF32950.1 alpha-amylase family glycosyl hydrolase [Arthrobacter agilis]
MLEPFLAPHHDGSALYVPQQSPRVGEELTIRLRVPLRWGRPGRVFVRSLRDGEGHYDEARELAGSDNGAWSWWEARVTAVNRTLRYRFLLELSRAPRISDGPDLRWLNAAGPSRTDTADRDDFRIDCRPAPEPWARDAVIYQVFPDRFARSSDGPAPSEAPAGLPEWAVGCSWDEPVRPHGDLTPRQVYGGTLDGVRERLDHLAELGASVLYLTPFFPARSNHRYDATTFDVVDPLLGGDEALVRLVEAAHARGIAVIGDLTINHTGDGHDWFRTALADPTSTENGFYYFSEDGTEYASWLGVPSLPKLDWSSPDLRRRFVEGPDSVVAHWLLPPFDLDGWRIDVANMTGRHGHDDHNREVAALIRSTMDAVRPGSMLLAESTGDATEDLSGHAWDGGMTYSNLTRPLWQWLSRGTSTAGINFFGTPVQGVPRIDGLDLVATHTALSSGFSWRVRSQNMTALNTHDTARASSVMLDGGPAVGLALAFCLPGLPTLFAGDEFGLPGINGEDARTPLPWDTAGGSSPGARELVRSLAVLRAGTPALRHGSVRWLAATADVVVLVREHAEECILLLAARADYRDVRVASDLVPGSWADARPITLELPGGSVVETAGGPVFSGSGPGVQVWRLPGVRPAD